MSIRTMLNRFLRPNAANTAIVPDSMAGYMSSFDDAFLEPPDLPHRSLCGLLRLFYYSNGMYESIAAANLHIARSTAQLRAIRNTVPAVVDFFGAKMWPTPLVVRSKNEKLNEAIFQVWKWSNWRAKSREFARWVALYGEAFIKVVGDSEKQRVWFECIETAYVSDFEEDERGYIVWIRTDIPFVPREGPNAGQQMSSIEVWSKDDQNMRRWEYRGDSYNRKLSDFGNPLETVRFTEYGINFVPFVRVPFKSIGGKRAIGAVQLQLETSVEGDLSATNLHALIFQELEGAIVLRSEGTDANNRPLPPPVMETYNASVGGQNADGSIVLGKRKLFRLPGNQRFEYAIPNINYEAALSILQDQDDHLKRVMPALAYAEITELTGGDLSGRAIRFKMTPAIDQVEEARGVGLERLEQADKMAITIGGNLGLEGFTDLGTFEGNDLEHEFEAQDVFPLGSLEKVQEERDMASAFKTWIDGGLPVSEALVRVGYTEEQAKKLMAQIEEKAQEDQAKAEALTNAADNTGPNGDGGDPTAGDSGGGPASAN